MDSITNIKKSALCMKHQKQADYIKIENIQEKDDIYYCSDCVKYDINFKRSDFMLLEQIEKNTSVDLNENQIKTNKQQIFKNLLDKFNDEEQEQIRKIVEYFDELKIIINSKLIQVEKSMINKLNQSTLKKIETIKQQYEKLELLDIIQQTNNKQSQLISSIINVNEEANSSSNNKGNEQQEINSELLKRLANECNKEEIQLNSEYPNFIKEQVIGLIDEIDFFNELINQNYSLNNLHIQHNKKNMKRYLEHTIQLQNDNNYFDKIKNSFQLQIVRQIFNNKFTFLSNNFKQQIEQHMINTFPFLQILNFENAIINQSNIDCLQALSEVQLNELMQLIKKQIQFQNNNSYINSRTHFFFRVNENKFEIFSNSDLRKVLQKYPIFDLIRDQTQPSQDISNTFELAKSSFQNFNQIMMIKKYSNQQINIQLNNLGQQIMQQCFSNFIIQNNKNYIFRVRIQSLSAERKNLLIGLTQDQNINSNWGYIDRLSCYLEIENDVCVSLNPYYGVSQIEFGNEFNLSAESMIEIRIGIQNQIFQILDYPNYNFKVSCDYYRRQLLTQLENLRLYVALESKNISITFVEALLVDGFEV